MASLMGVAFMLTSLGTLYAESTGEQNNPDKTCTYKKKCPSCSGEGGSCGDTPPEEEPVTIQISHDEECPSDPTEVGLDDSYELSGGGGGGARSLRAGKAAAVPIKIAGGFSPNFVNPSNLKIFGTGAEVVRDADANIRQVKGDTGFMDAVFTPETKTLELRMYKPDDIKAGKVNGLYQVKDGRTAHMVLRYVQEADNSFRRETVNNSGEFPSVKSEKTTQTVGPEPYTITHAKTYLKGEGLSAVEYRRVTNKITAIPNGEPQEEKYLCMVEELGSDGQWHVTERKAGRRAIFKEEDGFVPLYECNAVNEDGTPMNPIATEKTYTYYSDPLVPASYGKVRTLRSNDGYWENKYYDANTNAGVEMIRTESPWLNTAAHEPGEAPQGQIRIKSETRCSTDTGIEDITETVGGITIAKEWTEKSRADQQKVKLVRHQPHSGGDKITTMVRYRNAKDVPVHLRGKTTSIHYADGSMSLYSYTLNGQNLTITEDTGYGAGNSVNHGTRTVSIQDKDNGKLKEEVRYALEGGQAYWLGSKAGVTFDNAGTCLKWVYDNNPDDYTEQRKDCCHVTWERGRDGIETSYTYDDLGRKVSTTTKGITTSMEYKGLTTTEWKQATGDSQKYLVKEDSKNMAQLFVEQRRPGVGDKILIEKYGIDIAGRTMTTTTAYGTTQSQVYTADRQILSKTGTTGVTQTYMHAPSSLYGGGVSVTISDGTRSRAECKDLAGNTISETNGKGAITKNSYDSAGRLMKSISPDGETKLYSYDQDIVIQGLDLDGDGIMDTSHDRVEKSSKVYDSTWPEGKGSWKTVKSQAWQGNWQDKEIEWRTEDETLVRRQIPGTAGYYLEQKPGYAQRGANYSVTISKPGGEIQETAYALEQGNVRATTTLLKDDSGHIYATTGTVLDIWGNKTSQTNHNGTTAYTYDAATGYILSETVPGNQTTSYQYDDYNHVAKIVLRDGSEQHQVYDAQGNIIRKWGSLHYPVSYTYNEYGKLTGMTTYRAAVSDTADWPEGTQGDQCSWIYEPETGYLLEKKYPNGKGVSFTYTPGGKINTQTNARGNVTTYHYDVAGQFISTSNDDGKTPTKVYGYDQTGRMISALTEGVAAYQYIYNDQDQITREQITIPTVNGDLVRDIIRSYDSYGRPTGYLLKNGDAVEQAVSYTYTPVGQLAGVTADGKEFTYDYLPNAPHLISQMAAPVHTAANTYLEHRDLLSSKINRWRNKADTPVISGYTYTRNILEQLISVATTGEAFGTTSANWAWGYDVLGQVASANGDHYSYDQIGNRLGTQKGEGNEMVYMVNALNQYIQIGTITPAYDDDGNQLTGLTPTAALPGRDALVFSYNADNRPVSVAQGDEIRETYSYDLNGRRIQKDDTITLYNGYNAIAEYKSSTRTLKTTYAWGKDLSGKEQGAGGVGGLLSVTEYDRQLPLTSYPCYDGNGNITEYLTEENLGILAAHYEYDAFGNVIRKTGDKEYRYQFSTTPYDSLSGLNYYHYRHYDSVSGRWISRDILEENSYDLNPYGFNINNPVSRYDVLGMIPAGTYPEWGGGPPRPPLLPVPTQGNCYRYVCNDPKKPTEEPKINPGPLPKPGNSYTCATIINDIKSRGAIDPESDGSCKKCHYKVIGGIKSPQPGLPYGDYHWYRLDDDGTWSHKPGDLPVIPGVKDPITDALNRGYTIFCSPVCVPEQGIDVDS